MEFFRLWRKLRKYQIVLGRIETSTSLSRLTIVIITMTDWTLKYINKHINRYWCFRITNLGFLTHKKCLPEKSGRRRGTETSVAVLQLFHFWLSKLSESRGKDESLEITYRVRITVNKSFFTLFYTFYECGIKIFP